MAGFSYFELHTPNFGKAQSFYSELFNWKFEKLPIPGMDYATVETGAQHGTGAMADKEAPPHWLPFVNVESVERQTAKAKSLGARVLKEKTEVPGQGWFSVVSDPTGAAFALWEEAKK